MSETIRTVKSGRFSLIDNSLLENAALSLQAKGLQAYLLSRPDGWTISPSHLATTCKGGVSQIKTTLKELEIARYIHREQLRDDKGRMTGWISWIYENPALNPYPARILSKSRKSACGEPVGGKATPINTDSNKTDKNKRSPDRAIDKIDEPKPEPIEPETNHPHLAIEQTPPSPVSNPNISGETEITPACSIKFDKSVSKPQPLFGKNNRSRQQERASSDSWLQAGIANKRWRDLNQYREFEEYVRKWVENRPDDLKKAEGGVIDIDRYLSALIGRTARCDRDDSPDLICWHAWISEPKHAQIAQVRASQHEENSELASSDFCTSTLDKIRSDRAERKRQKELLKYKQNKVLSEDSDAL